MSPDVLDVELDDLDAVDKEILRLKWTNRNLSLAQIGQLLPTKIIKQAVHQRVKKPKFINIWDRLEKDIIWRIKESQDKAMTIVFNTLRSSDEKLAFQAAKLILEPILANCPALMPDTAGIEDLEWDITEAPIAEA